MKKSEIDLQRLIAELESDFEAFNELYGKWQMVNSKLEKITPDEFDWASVGYTLHNLYNIIENYFFRIAKMFENNLDPHRWHKDLINRMTLDIEGIRPAFMKKEESIIFNDLRAFRHVFRNIYQSSLDIDKLNLVNNKVPEIERLFTRNHEKYLLKLREILRSLST